MSLKTQADILNIAGQAAGSAGAGAPAGSDLMSGLNSLITGANQFMTNLNNLAQKTGMPLIGPDAAIRRLAPPAPAQAPAQAPPERSGPLLPAPPPPPAPPAVPALDWPAILGRVSQELDKRGISGLTVGQVLAFLQNKTLGELVNEVKNGSQPKG
ncbi:hypothetical protein Dform_00853 [Dehalogenimonas formicexedens]|uniref:Uncharacterized protein n=1 Tax=Dehalogenimonas formicexedens TaxID=1839801 RepID=A0A1P8F6X6_9CHLR|nr:hypothetical protein [Dehalogenimonas formicexedens]APV44198.1 hypothetical protein Dform_00853 [Dehalogenimonas formicexedens]